MGQQAVRIIIIFSISLFLSSFLVSYFALEMYGVTIDRQLSLPDSLPSYYGEQDFVSGNFNISTLSHEGSGTWTYTSGIGMVLTSSVSGSPFFRPTFVIDNIQKDSSNTYTNTYKINNSPKQDYSIILRHTGSDDHNEIMVKSDGFHVPNYFQTGGIILGDRAFISYPNANKIQNVDITTTYYDGGDTVQPYCRMVFNGQSFNFDNLHPATSIPFVTFKTYYGGVSTSNLGFTFMDFKSNNLIQNPNAKDMSNPITLVASLITLMLQTALWVLPESIMPLSLQILLIKTQCAALVIGIADFIRG